MALSWAVSAKNALSSHGGVSPNMMVFGRNPNLPSVLTDKPPALSSSSMSDVIRKNLNAMHKARQKYIEAESSHKIRRALRSKVRTHSDVDYETGEKVWYRNKNSSDWHGLATVIGKDGKVVLLRHREQRSHENGVFDSCDDGVGGPIIGFHIRIPSGWRDREGNISSSTT